MVTEFTLKKHVSMVAVQAKAVQDPHWPWSLTELTPPTESQLNESGTDVLDLRKSTNFSSVGYFCFKLSSNFGRPKKFNLNFSYSLWKMFVGAD